MNTINKKKTTIKDLALSVSMILLTIGILLYTYLYAHPFPVLVIIWLLWLTAMLFIGFQTTKGRFIYEFVLEAKIELMKVVWPTRQETIQTTTIVMVMVTLTGFVLWGIDSIMLWAIAKITHLG